MSPKAKPAPKKAAPAKAAKAAKAEAAPAKKSAKGAKAAKGEEVAAAPAEGEPAVDLDELEEAEDAAAAAGQNSSAAALAAATGGNTEMSASFKNFRHHPDMENFYRFIYENDLRHEALAIIDTIMVEKQARKAGKAKGAH